MFFFSGTIVTGILSLLAIPLPFVPLRFLSLRSCCTTWVSPGKSFVLSGSQVSSESDSVSSNSGTGSSKSDSSDDSSPVTVVGTVFPFSCALASFACSILLLKRISFEKDRPSCLMGSAGI